MKVHVDEERCEGHGRCYALAPLVFEPDDIGNGQAIGDGTVAAGRGGPRPAGRGQLPRARHHDRGGLT